MLGKLSLISYNTVTKPQTINTKILSKFIRIVSTVGYFCSLGAEHFDESITMATKTEIRKKNSNFRKIHKKVQSFFCVCYHFCYSIIGKHKKKKLKLKLFFS